MGGYIGSRASVTVTSPETDSRYVNVTGDTMTGGLTAPSVTMTDAFFPSTGYSQWKQTNYLGDLFLNNGADRFKIDASGRVTMPYQPAFMAYSNTYTASGDYPFVSFSLGYTGAFNRGNHFNLSTGVFTAPVAGAYQINYIFHDTAISNQRHIGRIFVNGTSITFGEVAEAYDIYSDVGGGVVLNLSANDNVTWNTHPLTWGSVTASAFLIG